MQCLYPYIIVNHSVCYIQPFSDLTYIQCVTIITSTALQFNVVITSSQSFPFFVGTTLNLTCTATFHTNVENGDEIKIEWSGPRNISGDMYNVSHVSDSGNIYIVRLIIDPVMVQDEGMYTCTAIITNGSTNQPLNASDTITVNVISRH